MNKVPLSHSVFRIPEWQRKREQEREGERDRDKEKTHEQQRCHVIADPPGKTQFLLALRSWEDARASSHLLVSLTPVSPGPFLLSVPSLWLLTDIAIANRQNKHQVAIHSNPCESEPDFRLPPPCKEPLCLSSSLAAAEPGPGQIKQC